MTDRGILFSAPMIKALLDGRKTMTRRLAWRSHDSAGVFIKPTIWQKVQPGDRMWVRETWKPHSLYAEMKPRDMPQTHVFYRADDAYAPSNTKWVPGIHMPRWASRLTLTVTAVKIEALHAIDDADAQYEGIAPLPQQRVDDPSAWWESAPGENQARTARESFRKLWNSLHGAESWDHNPDLCCMSFAVEQRNIDAQAES